jgi:hypothetical protein
MYVCMYVCEVVGHHPLCPGISRKRAPRKERKEKRREEKRREEKKERKKRVIVVVEL